jgi:hypothetical protein
MSDLRFYVDPPSALTCIHSDYTFLVDGLALTLIV